MMSDSPLTIDICVCTFRRTHVARTLESLAQLEKEQDWQIRVIVVDNDDTPSAKELVEKTAEATKLNVLYVHAPAFNISIARNACLNASTAQYLAFIDDDEVVAPNWLKELIITQAQSAAGMVLGPVRAIYSESCPSWMKKADTHATMPSFVQGEIVTGYSCNVLLARHDPAYINLCFREDLGKSGGEDTVFCASYHKAGGRIAFSPNAWVMEDVVESRQSLKWLLKRRFRFGQVHGLMVLEENRGEAYKVKHIAIATVKAAVCLLMALVFVFKIERSAFWLLRGALHLGVVSRLLGKRELQLYSIGNAT